jgi:succinyl-CoA synthetase beta subunit
LPNTLAEKIRTVRIDPDTGLTTAEAVEVARSIGIPDAANAEAVKVMQGLYSAFVEKDAMLAEINPLVLDSG